MNNNFIIVISSNNFNTLTEIKTLLIDSGYDKIYTYNDNNYLLEDLESEKIQPNLLICDTYMPNIDGFQVLRIIKNNPKNNINQIPIILFSSYFNDFETRKLAKELKAETFFEFPFNSKEFLNYIDKLVKNSELVFENKNLSSSEHTSECKIIILEDDKFNSRFLMHSLKDLKCKILTCESIGQFNEIFFQEKPQVCIVDYSLPDGNGLDVLNYIKLHNENTKVIMITSTTNERLIDDFIKSGAFDFISKPIDVRRLIKSVQDAIKNSNSNISEINNKNLIEIEKSPKNNLNNYTFDFYDSFYNAPLPFLIIDENLNCLCYNLEFAYLFKSMVHNLRTYDDLGIVNLEQILTKNDVDKLKDKLNEIQLKNMSLKFNFSFISQGLKYSIIIKPSSQNFIKNDLKENKLIFYAIFLGVEGYF